MCDCGTDELYICMCRLDIIFQLVCMLKHDTKKFVNIVVRVSRRMNEQSGVGYLDWLFSKRDTANQIGNMYKFGQDFSCNFRLAPV